MVLDKRIARKDLTYNLVFRISKNNKYVDIGTGVNLFKEQFDSLKQQVLHDGELNNQLQNLKEDYQKRLRGYLLTASVGVDIKHLKALLANKPIEDLTIEKFWLKHIEDLKSKGSYGNANVYSVSLKGISRVLDLQKSFSDLRYPDIVNLEASLYKRGMTANGISVYLRTFRSICNKAIEMEVITSSWYPFKKFKIKKSKTLPKVLTIDELKRYFSLNITESDVCYKSWLVGKLIYMLRGINLKDLLFLTKDNIKNGRIIYKRSKTGKLYSVKLTSEMHKIINEFSANQTLLGLLTDQQLKDKERLVNVYMQKRKLIYTHLKKIGKLINVEESISTYVFRYSYANVSKKMGYSKDLIAEALGHEYGNSVTGIYLEQFDLDIIDDMNEEVINVVLE